MLTATNPDPVSLLLPPAGVAAPGAVLGGVEAPAFAPTLAALLGGVTLPIGPAGLPQAIAASGKPLPATGEPLPVPTTDAVPADPLPALAAEGGDVDEAGLFAAVAPEATHDGDAAAEPALAWLMVPALPPVPNRLAPSMPTASLRPVAEATVDDAAPPPATSLRAAIGDGSVASERLAISTAVREMDRGLPVLDTLPPAASAPEASVAEPDPSSAPAGQASVRGVGIAASATGLRPDSSTPSLTPTPVPAPHTAAQTRSTTVQMSPEVSPSGRPLTSPLKPAQLVRSPTADGPALQTAGSRQPVDVAPAVILLQPAVESARLADRTDPATHAPPDDRSSPAGVTLSPTQQAGTAAPVAATGGAQQAGIDLTRDPGLHRMIDRIEQLRDAANANDTRIRLIPDALGPVEVSVRRDGDGVQVRFTAQAEATRQLIVDATPRLNELAEARGVRIDRTSVEAGTGHGWGEPSRHPAWAQPDQPKRPVPAAAAQHDEDSTDHRIA